MYNTFYETREPGLSLNRSNRTIENHKITFNNCLKRIFIRLQVFFSHHNPKLLDREFPDNVVHKSDVGSFSEQSVYFKDKTEQSLDAIIYCTGKNAVNVN